jgi:hypothetical protein
MLQDYTDEENLYPQQSFYSRPGVEGPRRVDVALLRTCKAVYAETRGLPAQQLEEIMVWFRSKQRAPEGELGWVDFFRFFDNLRLPGICEVK